jgi:IS30 family transposase
MPDVNSKNKHMTLDDRIEIQQCLDRRMTFKAIAERIGKDQTTVSKEVKKHLEAVPSQVKCLNPDGTEKEPSVCPNLLKVPFVCNPCQKRHSRCTFQKQFYRAKLAHTNYETLLSEAREGIPLKKESFYEIDAVVSKGIKQGQHLYHIIHTNDLGVSKSTIYRHLHRGYLSVDKLDFPRIVKFKQRRSRPQEHIPKGIKIGRTHADFLAYTKENGISSWVEMDTVIGRVGGKVIMTLDFTFCNFMVGILLDNKTSAEVATKVKRLKAELSSSGVSYGDVFPLILTDNGGEFADVFAIENGADGLKETMLFFCDPMQSCQKPKVEKNHTLFRDIVPKGESFDHFTQDTVNLIFSHVNSVKRKSLNGKSPYDVFAFTYGDELATILGIRAIPADQVTQSPRLLRD